MAASAYELEPTQGGLKDVGGYFNKTLDFGWENDGIRGTEGTFTLLRIHPFW